MKIKLRRKMLLLSSFSSKHFTWQQFIKIMNSNIYENNMSTRVDTKLKMVHWNCNNRANLTPDIGPEIKNRSSNILLCLNETFSLPDLSVYKLVGVRHQNLLSRGLCLFISEHLRHYTDFYFSKFSIYGSINLPDSGAKEALKIGFICSYRSPSLSADQNIEFFNDFNETACALLKSTSMVYCMGDFNVYEKRYFKDDTSKVAPTPACPNSLAYRLFMNSIPGPAHFYFENEPTHFPYQNHIRTCAKLDYLFVIYAGDKFPGGKKKLWITTSDHRALILQINVPYLANVKIRFSKYEKIINTDYDFIDALLFKEANSMKWEPEFCWDNLTRLEILKEDLIRAHSFSFSQNRPTGTSGFDSKIKILQQKASRARLKNDWESYHDLCAQIREVITAKATTALNDCGDDEDKKSGVFFKWAGSILKPNKAEVGKFTMTNKTVKEITDPINQNYMDPDPILPVFRKSTEEETAILARACLKFDFKKVLGKVRKVPLWFKQCAKSVIYIAERLTLSTIIQEKYENTLKICQADILPSRSIFQMINPFAKLVENFFAQQLQKLLSDCQNFAYRPNLSTTSLLLLQFDIIARKPLTLGLNIDLKKAFDRLSRSLVYDRIKNSALANIMWSWLDREDCPYFIWWRGVYHEISRDLFNRGCPPGSICGPITYILGQSDHLNFNLALFKSLFADDTLPLYELAEDLIEDGQDFADFVSQNGMELHTTGDKAAVFIGFGKKSTELNLDKVNLASINGTIEVKRSWQIRQLGLDIRADARTGRAEISLEKLINKLKHASIAMRVLAEGTLSSLMIDLLRTYLISCVSYGITVWYPLMSNYDPQSVNAVRYWYYSAVCYICTETKQVLSWSNSSHTMKKGHSCEQKFKDLCGMPTIEELAIASTKAHFCQIHNMVNLGWLKDIIYKNRDRLIYLTTCQIQKKMISPLKIFIDVIDKYGPDKLKFESKDSWLVQVEKELAGLSKQEVRFYQRAITLFHFKIEKDYFKRIKKSEKIRLFVDRKEKDSRKLLKKLKRISVKKINLRYDF